MIYCKDLILEYKNKKVLQLDELSINEHGIYILLGANGSGKSTFIKSLIMDGSVKRSGIINVNNKTLSKEVIFNDIAFMPQFLNVNFPFRAIEVVMMGHKEYGIFSDEKKIRTKSLEVMESLNILHLQNRNVENLSGGERALVFLAKTLCKNTNIILLDEPDSSLDFQNKVKLFHYLEANKKNKIIILSSHDIVSITKTDYIIKFSKNSNYKPIHKKDINKNELKDIFPDVNYDEILKDIYSIIN